MDDRIMLYGSFTSSSSYKPMLYLALARVAFSFRTVNLKKGVQNQPEYLAVNRYGKVPALRHRGLTIVQSNVILDYLARTTGHFEPRPSRIGGGRGSGCRGRRTPSPMLPRCVTIAASARWIPRSWHISARPRRTH